MRIKLLVLTYLIFSVGTRSVSAVNVTISNAPSSISDQPFNVDVSITGASTATNYLRADFFLPNTTNYFGYTFNETDWYNGSQFNQYLPVNIISSGYSGTIQTKIDTTSSKFQGNGTYNLRVRRYTQSGSYTSGESNIISLNVNIAPSPTPTPSPIPTSSPSPSPTSTKTPSPATVPKKTATPTSVPTPTPNPSPKDTFTPSSSKTESSFQPNNSKEINYRIASVAAVNVSATPEGKIEIKNQKQINPVFWIGLIFIFAGVSSIGYIYIKKNAKIHIPFRR